MITTTSYYLHPTDNITTSDQGAGTQINLDGVPPETGVVRTGVQQPFKTLCEFNFYFALDFGFDGVEFLIDSNSEELPTDMFFDIDLSYMFAPYNVGDPMFTRKILGTGTDVLSTVLTMNNMQVNAPIIASVKGKCIAEDGFLSLDFYFGLASAMASGSVTALKKSHVKYQLI